MTAKRTVLAVVLMVILVMVLFVGCQPAPTPTPQIQEGLVYGGAVYFPPGGNQLVAGSGGEIEVQSGATLDIQSGATATLGAYTIGWSAPITISGVLTNVRVLYYQVP